MAERFFFLLIRGKEKVCLCVNLSENEINVQYIIIIKKTSPIGSKEARRNIYI